MRLAAFAIAVLFALASPCRAEDATRDATLDLLFATLRAAPTAGEADRIESAIWDVWRTGPDEEATAALAFGEGLTQAGRFAEASTVFDLLIDRAPGFAEAWNQRAFALFLARDYAGSLADIAETLAREPRHFGALAGKARILLRMGKMAEARKVMGEISGIHPWLARRSAIPADPPAPPPVESRTL